MGIDIYLNGYDEYKARSKAEHDEFDRAVKQRDQFPRGSAEADEAQKSVEAAGDKMWAGKVGYLRSSYNGGGLFRVLEEIFGFDMAGYFFPGEWDGDTPVNGKEFVDKVDALQQTALLAMSRDQRALPWINEYTEVTGKVAPDVHPTHVGGEAFGDQVFQMIAGVFDKDKVEGGPSETQATLSQDHIWYLTVGLKNLRDFGLLARRMNEEGKKTFAYISY